MRWAAQIRQCERTVIDIDNPFLERFVQILLNDLGRKWSSRRPINTYYGVDKIWACNPSWSGPIA